MGETAMPSPINVAKLEELLQGYDKQKSQYLLNGFRNGFFNWFIFNIYQYKSKKITLLYNNFLQ